MKNYLLFLLLLTSIYTKTKTKKKTYLELSENDSNQNNIEGKMIINGESYSAFCDCSSNQQEEQQSLELNGSKQSKCDPLKLTINNEVKGKGASLNSIKKLIGNIKSLEYVDISNTLFKNKLILFFFK